LAGETDGDFVVTWVSYDQDGSSAGIFARRFSDAGVPLTSELQINSYTTGQQSGPSVATDAADGEFVVAWQSLEDGSGRGVFARRFSAAGAPLTAEFQVNTFTQNNQQNLSLAADGDGDFVVAWMSDGQDGSSSGVFARRFSSTGDPLAGEFQVNTYTMGDQDYPSVAVDAEGHFVIVWQDSARDGSVSGVFAQRFLAALVTVDIDGNGETGPLTDGLLVLRYLFGFRGAALITGAVGAGCTRCGAPAIEAYLGEITG
jgi:hypothetical protein